MPPQFTGTQTGTGLPQMTNQPPRPPQPPRLPPRGGGQMPPIQGQPMQRGGGMQGAGPVNIAPMVMQFLGTRMGKTNIHLGDAIKLAQMQTQTGEFDPFNQLSSSTQEQVTKLNTAENLLSQYESLIGEVGLGKTGLGSRIKGNVRQLGGKFGFDAYGSAYQDIAMGTIGSLVKALGETGSLSDADKKAAVQMLPKLTDSQKEAEIKIGFVRDIINKGKSQAGTIASGQGMSLLGGGGGLGGQYPIQPVGGQFGGGFGNQGFM